MSIKRFKFVSPGVFINEIDNSFRPENVAAIGPVVVGRATRGPAMRPVQVQSYSDFVETFGDTVPGAGQGDVYRNGNYQSPMYGTYAAKAFLRANVAPLTYIRLLGNQTVVGKAAGGAAAAGWKTDNDADSSKGNAITTLGGSYGLWVFESGSTATQSVTASLGAIIYCQNGAPLLSGSIYGGRAVSGSSTNGAALEPESPAGGAYQSTWNSYSTTASMGAPIVADSAGNFHVQIQTSNATTNASINFDDASDNFIRKKLNTNPQLKSSQNFYPSSVEKDYFLGESFEQDLRDDGLATKTNLVGIIYPIASSGSVSTTPSNMAGQAMRDAVAGWFISQDRGPQGSFYPQNMQKLFRLHGLNLGEWLHKNCKVSIARIRQSNTTSNPYGSFSLLVRDLRDTDSNIVVLERFDNLNLDPSSPNFIARRIGDQYTSWDNVSKRLKTFGEYPSQSKFIRVEMNADVEAGATDSALLPFGYWGPPKPTTIEGLYVEPWSALETPDQAGAATNTLRQKASKDPTAGRFIYARKDQAGMPDAISYSQTASAAGAFPIHSASAYITGTGVNLDLGLSWPQLRLRSYASNGKLTNPTNAYFGITSTRATGSTSVGTGISDPQMLL